MIVPLIIKGVELAVTLLPPVAEAARRIIGDHPDGRRVRAILSPEGASARAAARIRGEPADP